MNRLTTEEAAFRRAHGAAKDFQQGLIKLIATGKSGLDITLKEIGDPKKIGVPDDIFDRNERKALEEILIRSWRHAGFNDGQIEGRLKTNRNFDNENKSYVRTYFASRGLKGSDGLDLVEKGLARMTQDMADITMPNGKVMGMSLLYQTFVQYQPILKPHQITAPALLIKEEAALPPAAQERGSSPKAIAVTFSGNANMFKDSMPYYLYRTMAGLDERAQQSFKPRMEAFESQFAAKLTDVLKKNNVDVTSIDVHGLTKTILRSNENIERRDMDERLKGLINKTIQELSNAPMTVAIPRAAADAEKTGLLRDTPNYTATTMQKLQTVAQII